MKPTTAPPPDPHWIEPVSRPHSARWPAGPASDLLHRQGISHEQLADTIGTTVAGVRRALYDDNRFTTEQAQRLADALSIAPSTIWSDWNDVLDLRQWEPTPWATRAACKGHDEHFFPPPGERPENAEAREHFAIVEYCARCPVACECRDYARRNREYGIWGGETELDRAEAGFAPALPIGRVARAAQLHRLEHL